MSEAGAMNDAALHERLSRIWAPPPGMLGFFTAVNHRVVGLRFMVTAFVFFLFAGLLAVAVRLQLTLPLLGVLSPEAYNQAFTMHGSVMMFLFAIPFLEGLAIYFVPLMIGAREMAFPRLNAFGYWIFLFAGLSLFVAWLTGYAPDAGWYNYPPLTSRGFSPGANIDFWVVLITFLEVSALVAAVEIIVTILKHRAPGLTLARLPVFVWAAFITALMIVFAMPAVVLASFMLGLDRIVGTHFFNFAAGGDPLLWQHLFWFFGHPDVYIMLLPGIGAVSMIIPAFARRPLAGYTLVVAGIIIIGLLSFGVWVHHMYTVGLSMVGLNFFAAASMLFAIPSAIHILSWITTLWFGRLEPLRTPMLFSLAFIVLFILGGITGIMIAAVPLNWQVHDTYFIVAHFHYTMVGGVVFPLFAAIYYWFPKVSGRFLDERLGVWHFWLFLVGFNVTFLLMHVTGLEGMPRRVYTYLPGLGWDGLNALSTAGALIMAAGTLVFLVNLFVSWREGRPVGDDAWGAATLEWSMSSPPPNYNFLNIPFTPSPSVAKDPASDARAPDWQRELAEARTGLRENPVTSIVEAKLEGKVELPMPSPWPFWTAMALSLAFLGVIWYPWLMPLGLGLAFVCIVGWHAPPRALDPEASPGNGGPGPDPASRGTAGRDALSASHAGLRSPILWGVIFLVLIELTVLVLFVASMLYLQLGADTWPPAGVGDTQTGLAATGQLLLLASAIPAWLGLRALSMNRTRRYLVGLATGLVLAAGYPALKFVEYGALDFRWDSHAYGSVQWAMSGYSLFHVLVLILAGGVFWVRGLRGHAHAGRVAGAQALMVYWAFAALGSLFFLGVQYPDLLPWR